MSEWPPDWRTRYVNIFADRQKRISAMVENPALAVGAKEYYRSRPNEFIEDWVDTYDPRNAGTEKPTRMPFVLFDKQKELVEFLYLLIDAEENALIEKARDMGATWLSCALSVHLFLFKDGASVGWGSRKELLVDRIGDPDSIFEKIRMILRYLPPVFLPFGWDEQKHSAHMKLINPQTGATITGEAGDNIGRGGRKLIYFKDESAHYDRPEKIEAALGDTTRCQVDISSVNGLGNVFHRKRENGKVWHSGEPIAKGKTNVFIMDWRDHPMKDQSWYDARRQKAEEEGLLHLFAQEVDRDYASAVENVIIPSDWVNSAIDAHLALKWADSATRIGGLDVADEGQDKNAFAHRLGSVLVDASAWAQGDTGETARKVASMSNDFGRMSIQYDSVGIGAGVKAEFNRLQREELLSKEVKFNSWNAAAKPLNPEKNVNPKDKKSPLNKDFYSNLKAQGWWELRKRFENTHKARTQGIDFSVDEMISISSDIKEVEQLKKELCQPTISRNSNLKLVVDKAPEGTRSPNLADAVMMCYWPVSAGGYTLRNL